MRRPVILLAGVLGTLSAMFVLAPFMAPYGAYLGLDGDPCFVDHPWRLSEAPYLLGDVLCHQEQGRSFVLNGSQMPVCARDIGIWPGLAVGLLAYIPLERRFGWRMAAASVLMMCVTVAEWALEPRIGNVMWVRFASGIVAGIGAGMLAGWLLGRLALGGEEWNEQA